MSHVPPRSSRRGAELSCGTDRPEAVSYAGLKAGDFYQHEPTERAFVVSHSGTVCRCLFPPPGKLTAAWKQTPPNVPLSMHAGAVELLSVTLAFLFWLAS